jgi:hypothetical protein
MMGTRPQQRGTQRQTKPSAAAWHAGTQPCRAIELAANRTIGRGEATESSRGASPAAGAFRSPMSEPASDRRAHAGVNHRRVDPGPYPFRVSFWQSGDTSSGREDVGDGEVEELLLDVCFDEPRPGGQEARTPAIRTGKTPATA